MRRGKRERARMQEGEKDIQKELTGVERRKEVLANQVGEVNKPVLITGEEWRRARFTVS